MALVMNFIFFLWGLSMGILLDVFLRLNDLF